MRKSLLLIILLFAGLMVFAGCGEKAAVPEEEVVFEVIDRSSDKVASYVCDHHWHGSLPEVPKGNNVSLGAYIEDENGDFIELDGEQYALGVNYAEGTDESVVSFNLHCDHVQIIGEEEGTTDVVFQIFHDGHVDFETPAIDVNVVSN